ncbi:hypothetical protein CFC21_001546 [Triticum aestivum]|uniref:Uncharacterized protein n=2 Tax=Triticum TaxID=4564 RepID=A0A9R0Q735_TRITD|nr:hypothetical protein CFC21_001546 [Triticum aestivum]VAH04064.1 unnamed protein product [Triticum turgidum subsp. durum]
MASGGVRGVNALAMVEEAGSWSSRRPALRYVQQRASGKIACAVGRQLMCINTYPLPGDNDVLCSLLLGMATRSATVQSPHGPSFAHLYDPSTDDVGLIPFCLAYMSASMWISAANDYIEAPLVFGCLEDLAFIIRVILRYYGKMPQSPQASGGGESVMEGRFDDGVAITAEGMPLATQTTICAALGNNYVTSKDLRWLASCKGTGGGLDPCVIHMVCGGVDGGQGLFGCSLQLCREVGPSRVDADGHWRYSVGTDDLDKNIFVCTPVRIIYPLGHAGHNNNFLQAGDAHIVNHSHCGA